MEKRGGDEMGGDERRRYERVACQGHSTVIVCGTRREIHADLVDMSLGGVGLTLPADTPDLRGEDLLLAADTLIMYGEVVWQVRTKGGTWRAGLSARKFSPEILQYLLEGIQLKTKSEESQNE